MSMAPPPRPPIICIDLPIRQSAPKAPRVRPRPSRENKLTIVQDIPRNHNEEDNWNNWNPPNARGLPDLIKRPRTISIQPPRKHNPRDKVVRLNLHNSGSQNYSLSPTTSPIPTPIPSPDPSSSPSPIKKQEPTRQLSVDFSFYKGNPNASRDVLEVSGSDFFEKLEDRTMMEVNELMRRVNR